MLGQLRRGAPGQQAYAHLLIVPTLCVGTPPWTLCVHSDAERHGIHSHAERGNDLSLRSSTSTATTSAAR
ncbi:hypothetical protein B4O85_03085 [Pseudomonas azotoformans]|uniref:Uncharacterized protein n=1 Tax=Pseudomonas azotoformans TaxID=47878 RepID=A0A4Q0HX03_PSEAZ|nr:hypothetical protein B4O85_03085 [Pseudomonas azotoformans]